MTKILNRVFETTTTTGTGALTLLGAVTDFEAFRDQAAHGDKVAYVIVQSGAAWEAGIGTLSVGSPDTLSRDTVEESSNSDALVNFGAGTKNVFCAPSAAMLQGILDTFIGTSRPAFAPAGFKWIDNTAEPWLHKLYDGADDIVTGKIDPTNNKAWPAVGTIGDELVMDGKRLRLAKGADIASAATLVLGNDGNYFVITGSTGPVTAITVPAGTFFMLQFASTPQFNHHATNLNLPGGANITMAAGDRLIGFATADNQVHALDVIRASGVPLAGSSFGSALIHVRDEKAANTNGGTFTSGSDQVRVLNTVLTNEIAGASLATNQITLPAGKYYVEARAPAYKCGVHRALLYNASDSATLLLGANANAANADATDTHSFVSGRFTLAATKDVELRHRCATTQASNGLGNAHNFGGVEVYSDVRIWKVG